MNLLRNSRDRGQVFLGLIGATIPILAAMVTGNNYLVNFFVWFFVWWVICRNNYILHNHIHTPFFRIKFLNKAFDIILALSTGMPAGNWKLMHVHGHHAEPNVANLEHRSYTHRFVIPEGTKYSRTGAARYVAGNILHQFTAPPLILLRYLFGSNFKRGFALYYLTDYLLLTLYLSMIGAISMFALGSMVTIYILVTAISMSIDFLTHTGEHESSEIAFSNSCRNDSYNRNFWNFGYHIGHHISPKTHWSELPEKERALGIKPVENREQSRAINFFGLFRPKHVVWKSAKRE